MEDWPRYRIVSSISRQKLTAEIRALKRLGWKTLGEPALAVAASADAPPYWVQTLYRSKQLPPVVIVTSPPRASAQARAKTQRRSRCAEEA